MITPKQVRELLEAATPGPWVAFDDDAQNVVAVDDADYREVGMYSRIVKAPAQWFKDANAELMAAAPDIAAAYLELVDILEKMGVRWAEAKGRAAS